MGTYGSDGVSRKWISVLLFVASFEVVAFDDRATAAYRPLRAYLKAQGTPIGPVDSLIAAHAVSLGASLVTNNVRELGPVPGLKLENWLKSIGRR
jgi:tRNA(fMet)-specific endonuclease VapC